MRKKKASGDRNTKFFQQGCTRRCQKSIILFIHKSLDLMVTSPLDVDHDFICFLSNLFTSTIPRLDFNFNHDGTITNEFTNSLPSIDECCKF
jgi:hypothetical protein